MPQNSTGTNATVDTTPLSGLEPTALPTDLASLWTFLLSFGALRDWLKFIVFGGILETIRRFASTLWSTFIDSFFLTVHFENDDDSFQWMMVWLGKQPAWAKAREVQVSTRGWGINDYNPVIIPGEEIDGVAAGTGSIMAEKRKLAFLPSFDTTHTVMYKRHYMRVTRTRRFLEEGNIQESLRLSILARNHSVLNMLLREAKQLYESEEQHRVQIYIADQYNNWRRSGSRPKRPMKSIVLDPGVKDYVLEDAREFLASETWYSERGIPFRRGYLLHGEPGSGKTSLIHSLAGELNLDIYVISLSKRNLDDASLNDLICELPSRSIALIEEVDAAFHRGITREKQPSASTSSSGENPAGVTLSGLLGAIDGVAAQEGRLLFATTNKYRALDPALTRPGRMDVHIEFTLASKWQAEELFRCFYPAYESPDGTPVEDTDVDEKTLVASTSNSPTPVPSTNLRRPNPPKLSRAAVDSLAKRFAECIPEKELSMASLQGHLMGYKSSPVKAVEEASAFVEKVRRAKKEREEALKAEAAATANTSASAPASDKTDDTKETAEK